MGGIILKKGIAVVIIALFIFTPISSMVIGYKSDAVNNNEREEFLEKLDYLCYEQCESPKLPQYKAYLQMDNTNIIEYKEVIVPIEPLQTTTYAGPPQDSPWPMYCHDVRHTGRSPYSTEAVTDFEKARIHDRSFVEAGPSIASDGTIYFGGGRYLYAIYSNFTLKWKFETSGLLWFGTHPTIDENGTVYIGNYHNDFYAINPDGTQKWKYNAGDSIASSSAIDKDGIIYFGDFGGDINALYPNGTVKWKYRTDDAVLSCPAIGGDGTIYCGSHDYHLYALYPNGTLRWKFKTGHWVRVSPCIADDGTIYVVSLDYYLHAVNPDGSLKWKTNVGAGTSPTIGQDGTIYAGYSKLFAINPINGSVKWTFNPGNDRRIRGGTPCNSIDGTIYIGTNIGELGGGEIIAVNPNGTEKWRKKISYDGVESPPCVGEDGTVYIGSSTEWGGYLHAFGSVESNEPPETPTISGETNGKPRVEYAYKLRVVDPDNNPISFYIEWGDGTHTGWTSERASRENCYYGHTWLIRGNYKIRVKAKDVMGEESDWGTLEVSMPKNQAINTPFLQFLENHPRMFPILRQLLNLQ